MRYGSICSGIEAATVAWHPLGFDPAFFSEIDPQARAVLAHHYPDVPLHGDFTTIGADDYGAIDLLVGGTPCQSFSVAGLRKGLADERGNLTLGFVRLAQRKKPRWLVWENVPGVLSDKSGAFGALLRGLAECGYGFAYRILDAQYFGVPQRRRRVFVIGYFGDWRPAAAVLFEQESLRGDITPSRETGACVAALTAAGVGTCGADDNQGQAGHLIHAPDISPALKARDYKGPSSDGGGDGDGAPLIAHTLRGEGFDGSEDGCGRGTPLVPVAIPILEAGARSNKPIPINTQMGLRGPETSNTVREGIGIGKEGDPMFTLQAAHHHAVAFAIPIHDKATRHQGGGRPGDDGSSNGLGIGKEGDPMPTLDTGCNHAVAFEPGSVARNAVPREISETVPTLQANMGDNQPALLQRMQVRRITPRECERLQAFPDDYTIVPYKGKPMADGARYKMLGNSMHTGTIRWLGDRIKMVEGFL